MKNKKFKFILLSSFILFIYNFTVSQELTPEQILYKLDKYVVSIQSFDKNGQLLNKGSGIIINEKGWILTSFSILEDFDKMIIKQGEKFIEYYDIVGADIEIGIIILKIKDNSFTSISFGNINNLKKDQKVYAIWNLDGIINSVYEKSFFEIYIDKTDSTKFLIIGPKTSPVSYGGGVVDEKGELIGIFTHTMKFFGEIYSVISINDILNIKIDSYKDKNRIKALSSYYKGENTVEINKYEEKANYYSEYLKIFNNDAKVYYKRGDTYFTLRDYNKAISDYTIAIELNRHFKEAYFRRGEIYNKIKEYNHAISDYTFVIELDNSYNNVHYERGLIYYKLKEYSKAISDFSEVIKLDSSFRDAYFNRGHIYYQLKEYSKAISDFSEVIKLDSSYCNAYFYRGNIFYELEDYINAIFNYTKAIENEPYDCNKAFINRGYLFIKMKEYNNAISDFSQGIENNKFLGLEHDNANAYNGRGNAYIRLKQYENAIADYSKSIFIDSNAIEPYNNRGIVYAEMGQYYLAIIDYTKAIELDPHNAEVYHNRGLSYSYIGDKDKACKDFYISKSLGNEDAKMLIDIFEYCR